MTAAPRTLDPIHWTEEHWERFHRWAQALGRVGPKSEVCPPCPEPRGECYCREVRRGR